MVTITEETTETPQLDITLVVDKPIDDVWDALLQRADALLGEGGELGRKGEPWRAADGTFGVTRSYHPKEQIRFSWHADEEAPRTLVELNLTPDGEQTLLDLSHQLLAADADRDALATRWREALQRIADAA